MNIDIQANISDKITLFIHFMMKKNNSVSSLSQLISIYFTSIVICTFLVNSSRIRVSNIESFTSLKDGITSPCMCRLKVLAWKCSRMRKIGRHMNAWRGMNLKKNIHTGIEHQIGKHSKEILLVPRNLEHVTQLHCVNCTSSYQRIWYWRRNFSLLFSYLDTVVEYVVLDMGTKERKWNLNKRQFFSSQDLYRPIFYAHEMKYILLFLICIEIVYPVKRPLHT